MAADRRLLVSARRDADRRLLAIGRAARRPVAARPGRRRLSGPRLTKIAILGAGSIGCFVGGCWQVAGLDVSFIGRERLCQALADRGLTLSDYSGWQAKLAPEEIHYAVAPQSLGDADII